ncbi:MAG TPA: flippase-like domain-containing protein [Acidobacteriota bacterium]|nr:flippase-like domain-containing protein [Acidobacteriota bacterium]
MSLKMPGKGSRFLLVAAGVALFFYLIWRIGFEAILANISRFGVWFLAILAVGASWLFFQTCAWSIIQNAFFKKVPFLSLFRIKIIGDALNVLLPSASLGGEAARAYLLKKAVPLKEGIPSIVFDKTVEFVASTVFLAAGLLLGSLFVRLPEGLLAPTVICLAVTTAGLVLLVVFSVRGVCGTLARITTRFPKVRKWVADREEHLEALDENLRLLYRKGHLKTAAAVGFHFLGRLAGAFEVLIVLRVLGVPVGPVQAVFIYSVIVVINTVFFILPGQWGVTESASMLLLQALGRPAAIGLSLGVIRRIRKLVFVALAFGLYFVDNKGGGVPRR